MQRYRSVEGNWESYYVLPLLIVVTMVRSNISHVIGKCIRQCNRALYTQKWVKELDCSSDSTKVGKSRI